MSSIKHDVLAFLRDNFPGSRIDDGYYFVAIRDAARALVRHDRRQAIADRLSEGECYLISVGVDPRRFVSVSSFDECAVEYNPDWDVHVDRPQWVARLAAQHIDLEPMLEVFDAEAAPCALVLINPQRRVVLDVLLRTVHAPESNILSEFLSGLDNVQP